MKKLFILVAMVLSWVVMMANPVDPDKAVQVAKNFVKTQVKMDSYNATLVYTHPMPRTGEPAFYAVNVNGSAFVLVAANDIAHPVLGYSTSRAFPEGIIPAHIMSFYNDLASQIEAAIEAEVCDVAIASEWQQLTARAELSFFNFQSSISDSVGPLLTTTWDQGQYYNALCPEDANGPAGHALTGCVATAMAQIINYWGYPVHGRGTHSYQSNYSTLSVNYDSATYDYANMPAALTSTSTQQEVQAVATLMRDCGVAVNMGYGPYASGTNNLSVRIALVNNYLFSDSTSYVCKKWFRFSEWDELLRLQLRDSLPIIYGGVDTIYNTGHSFVCDGYKTDGFFHFNFGWSGNGDGWFRTASVDPGIYDFNSTQAALINIMPSNNNTTILNYLQGKSSFTANTQLHVYYSLGLNLFRGPQDNLYWDWDTLVFYPTSENRQLEFDMNRHPSPYNGSNDIYVYDGENTDSLLHLYSVFSGDPDLDRTYVISTRGVLSIELSGWDGFDGFDFVVSEYNGCKRVSNVVVETVDSSAIITWMENGESTQWQIEYGLNGFEHGTGTIITVDTNSVTLDNLSTYEEYNIYVRSMCNDSLFGEWSQKMTCIVGGSLWKDIVTSQPEGYQIDQDSNIFIYSAEGLAWLINVAFDWQLNHFDGWTVHLMNDVDLYGYTWTPIYFFKGRFEGHGHIIQNMYVLGNNDGGLFGDCYSPLINDVHMRDVYVKSLYRGGSIAGIMNGMDMPDGQRAILKNCSATGVIDVSEGPAGGLVGSMSGNIGIINSWTACRASTPLQIGGVCGSAYRNCIINNCVTYGSTNSLGIGIVYAGALAGYSEYTTVKNSYALLDNYHPLNNIFDAVIGSEYYNLQWFSRDDTIWRLLAPIPFENDTTDELVQALNNGVVDMNIEGMRTWIADTNNDGLPAFGPYCEVVCPNVSDINIKNIINEYNENGIVVSWQENGNATVWELRYHIKDSTEESHTILYNNPDTLYGLNLQQVYLFSIRPICDSIHHGAWVEDVSYLVDIPYWKDIVTTQPDGYVLDDNGNVIVSSAEGLAWLISVVNGLNGEQSDNFQGRKVSLIQHIDLAQYKWTPINNFMGTFNGNEYHINNLYLNEIADYCGFFGKISGGQYKNIYVDSAHIQCKEYAGILFGEVLNAEIINCHVSGSVYAELNVGGFAGVGQNNSVNISGFVGSVQAMHHYAGGFFGAMTTGTIRNCNSRCNVAADGYGAGGIVGSCYSGIIENCYSVCEVNCFMYVGGITGSFRSNQWLTPSVMRNCYAVSTVFGSGGELTLEGDFSGAIIGTTDADPTISHCYGMSSPLVGPAGYSDDNVYPIISDTSVFAVLGDSLPLANIISVGNNYYSDMLSALNAWVDANNTNGQYRHWAADSTGENGGFPVFAAIPCPVINDYDTVEACENYTWNGTQYNSSIVVTDTLFTINGCDSTVTLHLTINNPVHIATTETACESYTWNNTAYTTSGNYTFSHLDVNGCTQVDTLHLTINNPVHTATTETVCESYTWNNTAYTTSGNYTFSHLDANGCTQVDTLHLTINNPVHTASTETACESYTWHNTAYTTSGNYTFSHLDANGCTQVDTLHLTINNPVHISTTETACKTYTWNNMAYTTSGNYTFSHLDANGCTQVDTLHLTINNPVHTTTTETACETYTWNNTTYTTSGNYTFSHLDANGCTQVDTLHLTINNPVHTTTTETACESYTWNNTTYTTSGNYTFSHLDVNGCTQVDTLHLTINNPVHTATTETACESYAWNNTTYTTSGNYTFSHLDANGCTQVDTLHLTINYSTTGDTTAVACDSFTWWNTNYTNSTNTPTHTYTNVAGCDSVVTLHLTINYSVETTVTETSDDSYTWNDETYTESGTYQWHGTTVDGCDSTVTLILTINTVGIDEIEKSKWRIDIFPNPTTGWLTIDNEDVMRVEVMDGTGRSVLTVEHSNHIDLSKLPDGIYILQITTPQGRVRKRVILK